MKTEIESAIKKLLGRINDDKTTMEEALKFTQAALNLAHTDATLSETERNRK